MCGIAGTLFWEMPSKVDRPADVVRAMVTALAHRGPDGHDVVECHTGGRSAAAASVVFGHRRLAIIDLSDRAAQPMRSERHPIWLTFNGEIYNFADVRADLEKTGRRFRTTSDTEVILQGYEEWGRDVLERLRGMFAIAIWDGRTEELLLARDRMGIKPLYVHQGPDHLIFASELRALLATPFVPARLDRIALEQYLAYQTVPAPRTLVEGVRVLLPGHVATISRHGRTDRTYWDLLDSASVEPATTAEGMRRRVGALLEESAALHLVSDVPVGLFLSGGIDSSAIAALTHKAGLVPQTFSVVLPGTRHDEAPFARAVAKRFGATHTEIALNARDLTAQMPDALARVDHPSGDGLNTFVISQAVRAAGFKVALSGLGGDEIFGGYPSFDRAGRFARYARAWRHSPAPVRSAAAAAIRVLGRSSVASTKAAAVLETDGDLPHTFPVMRQLFAPADRRALLGDALVDESRAEGDPYVALLESARARHPDAGLMSMVSYAESRTYMHDVLLRDTDQMSMAHGLEVRVPFLDHRLIEYVMGLPDAAKAPAGQPKRLLVESLGADLPPECVNRPKQGFVLPFDEWMKGALRPFCEQHLGPAGVGGSGVIREAAVRTLWTAYLSGDRRTSWSRLWALVALGAWLERTGVRA